LDTKNNVKKDTPESIVYADWNFTGNESKPVDKLQIMYMETASEPKPGDAKSARPR
jgi:hypothetical protein